MLTQDPLGLAGGVNLYEYAGSNPVSFDDPFGLCPLCIGAGLGSVVAGGVQVAANLIQGRSATAGLGQALLVGAIVGGTFGAAAPEATAALGARLTVSAAASAGAATAAGAAASQGKGVTASIVSGLQKAGGDMEARTMAVANVISKLPGQRVLMQPLEGGGRMLSGGSGNNLRQVILNADGTSVVRAYNATKDAWTVVKEITP